MNEPLTPERLAHARDLCGKASPGPWSVPHLSKPEDDPTKCRCPYVLSEGYFGSICDISVDNGLKVSDGGNGAPPLEEARANGELIGISRELIPDLLEDRDELLKSLRLVASGQKHLVMYGSYGCLTDDCSHWDDGTCSHKEPYCRIGRTL